MSVDLRKVQFSTTANAFKNTGVYTTSITMSGALAAFQERTFTSSITLSENQEFVFARARYAEYSKAASDGTFYWQVMPTFDLNVPTVPIGTGINLGYLLVRVNGTQVTFIAGVKNGLGSAETIVSQTINIEYVTYTLAR